MDDPYLSLSALAPEHRRSARARSGFWIGTALALLALATILFFTLPGRQLDRLERALTPDPSEESTSAP